jgi:polyisoprenoid-binding protein YceI
MKKPFLAALAVVVPALALAIAYKSATSFSLKDPKGVNTISFTLDGRFEHITGYTTAIDGNVTFDPAAPEKTSGKVVVQAGSLQATHTNMNEHMKQAMWLDTTQFPTIEFEITKVANVKVLEGTDPSWTMDVTGDFTLKGVKKSLTVPVKVTHMPGQLAKRNRGAVGDLMAIRSTFTFNRRDFGVNGNQVADIVADEVTVSFSIAAFAPKTG